MPPLLHVLNNNIQCRADSWLAFSQWERVLLGKDVSLPELKPRIRPTVVTVSMPITTSNHKTIKSLIILDWCFLITHSQIISYVIYTCSICLGKFELKKSSVSKWVNPIALLPGRPMAFHTNSTVWNKIFLILDSWTWQKLPFAIKNSDLPSEMAVLNLRSKHSCQLLNE